MTMCSCLKIELAYINLIIIYLCVLCVNMQILPFSLQNLIFLLFSSFFQFYFHAKAFKYFLESILVLNLERDMKK